MFLVFVLVCRREFVENLFSVSFYLREISNLDMKRSVLLALLSCMEAWIEIDSPNRHFLPERAKGALESLTNIGSISQNAHLSQDLSEKAITLVDWCIAALPTTPDEFCRLIMAKIVNIGIKRFQNLENETI